MDLNLIAKMETSLDLLATGAESEPWLRDFFEKRPSAGYYDNARDPADFAIRAAANHSTRAEAMSFWVAHWLTKLVEHGADLADNIRERWLLEGLFEWSARIPNPNRFANSLADMLDIASPHFADKSKWPPHLLRVFKHALIHNQANDRLREVWLNQLDASQAGIGLDRDWLDDFDGILHMPAAHGAGFDWNAIGLGLKAIYETRFLPDEDEQALSPTGPMLILYRQIEQITDLRDQKLNTKLWEAAADTYWSDIQQQTIPSQYFQFEDGDWLIPRIAYKKFLAIKNIQPYWETDCAVRISSKAHERLGGWRIKVIRAWELERINSPRRIRSEMFKNIIGRHIPRDQLQPAASFVKGKESYYDALSEVLEMV